MIVSPFNLKFSFCFSLLTVIIVSCYDNYIETLESYKQYTPSLLEKNICYYVKSCLIPLIIILMINIYANYNNGYIFNMDDYEIQYNTKFCEQCEKNKIINDDVIWINSYKWFDYIYNTFRCSNGHKFKSIHDSDSYNPNQVYFNQKSQIGYYKDLKDEIVKLNKEILELKKNNKSSIEPNLMKEMKDEITKLNNDISELRKIPNAPCYDISSNNVINVQATPVF